MKRRLLWLPILAVVLAVIFVLAWTNSKAGVISHVQRNVEPLEEYAQSCAERPEDHIRYQSWNTSYRSYYDIVVFQVSYLGFGSQADEKGFYYAPDGQPRTLGCDLDVEETETGVKYLGEGDNYVYTEPIAPNWFWFEQHW